MQIENEQPTDTQASFLARAAKAVTGGLTGLVTGGAGTAIASSLSDGVITGSEWWTIAGAAVGGFVLGFAAVYRVPNAE